MHKCMAGKLGIFTSIRSSSYLISALSSTICEETPFHSILFKFTMYLKLTAGFSACLLQLTSRNNNCRNPHIMSHTSTILFAKLFHQRAKMIQNLLVQAGSYIQFWQSQTCISYGSLKNNPCVTSYTTFHWCGRKSAIRVLHITDLLFNFLHQGGLNPFWFHWSSV